MDSIKHNTISLRLCSLRINWLILAFFAIISLVACSGIHSVRNNSGINPNMKYIGPLKKTAEENIVKEEAKKEVPELTYNYKEIPADTVEPLMVNTNQQRKIPTIREQMKNLADNQESINLKITELSDEVKAIKNYVKNIADGSLIRKAEQETFISEPKPKIKSTKNKSNVILSDEEVNSTKPSKKINMNEEKPPIKKINIPQKEHNNLIARKSQKKELKKEAAKQSPQPAKQQYVSPNPKDLEDAMVLISQREYNRAIEALTKVSETNKSPEVVSNCNYWLGEAYFGLKDYNQSIKCFQKVLKFKNSNKRDEAQVMIAEAHVRSGQLAEARKDFQSLIANFPQSEYIARAKKMLQQL